jgi:hypothetical protein
MDTDVTNGLTRAAASATRQLNANTFLCHRKHHRFRNDHQLLTHHHRSSHDCNRLSKQHEASVRAFDKDDSGSASLALKPSPWLAFWTAEVDERTRALFQVHVKQRQRAAAVT